MSPMRRGLIALVAAASCAVPAGVATATATPAVAAPSRASGTTSPSTATGTSAFVALAPCRLFDSRDAGTRLADHRRALVPTDGRCDIPDGTVALALSVTATQPLSSGFATLWPGDEPQPPTSTVNYATGETRANGAIIALGADGTIAVSASAAAHVVIDVTGAFVATATARAGRFVATSPTRLLDTRVGDGRLPRGGAIEVALPAGVPADATAVAVTIATSDSVGAGFFTAYANGDTRPLSSALNTDGRGQVRATGAIVPVGAGGFTVYSQSGEHLIVDMTGWFTGPSSEESDQGLFVAASPTRLLDTRTATTVFRGGSIEIDPTAVTGGPVSAIAANWTLTETWRGGFLTVHPARTERPLAATVNADRRRQDVAQFGITATSTSGLAAFSSSGTHLVVDVTGWFTGTPSNATSDVAAPNHPVADVDRRVLLVGDSTLAGVRWYTNSQHALVGSNFVLDAESCRRLVGASCRGREGRQPPNAIQAIHTIGATTGPVDAVVVMTGYNDWYTTFPAAFDQVVAAARAAGATEIIWLTYRERSTYTNPSGGVSQAEGFRIQNQTIRDKVASGAYDDVTVLDWSAYTDARDDWFTRDGVHFTIDGAYGAADYISRAVAATYGEPCPAPWTPGGSVQSPCAWPDSMIGVVDPMALYAGNPSDIHCYEVGTDRHVECRVDPKLAH
ncbi:MAG: SGNH/GDSL hydrolase family protein [Acidimicrobiales bacterium]|nr:SGNH/GDSL hydrolase family protein [Acidimicrobiales bacterium]